MPNTSGALSGAASGAAAGSAFGPWGTVIGGVVGAAGSLLGQQKAPATATYNPVNANAVVGSTIAGNLGNLPGASELAKQVNTTQQSEASRLLEQAIPGFSSLQQKLLGKVNEDLNNETNLPADVQSKLSQVAAEKGVQRGTSGNFNGFSLVKDFGFSMLDYKNASRARALNTLSTVFGMTPRISPMSPMSSLLDNGTAIGVQQNNNQMAFNSTQAGNNAGTAASNYNAQLLAGGVMNAGNLFAAYMSQPAGGVQSKALAGAQMAPVGPASNLTR